MAAEPEHTSKKSVVEAAPTPEILDSVANDKFRSVICTRHKLIQPSLSQIPCMLQSVTSASKTDSPKRLLQNIARLGLPLLFQDCGKLETADELTRRSSPESVDSPPGTIIVTPKNDVMALLSIQKMPDKKIRPFFNDTGNVMLTRADGKELLIKHFYGLWRVIYIAIAETRDHDSFHAKMTPEYFVKHWKWDDVECPVKLGCKSCGKKDSEVKLMRCGKCAVVSYCGKECQKSDWASHKKTCVKG